MSWKNTLPFFAWQTLRFSRNAAEFKKNWGHYPRWMGSFRPGRNSVNDESAWITFEALDYLNAHLRPEHRVFEYGGGGSTLFFCKRVAAVVTVEHHEEWFRVVEKTIKSKGYSHWTGFFAPPEPVADGHLRQLHDPAHFKSSSPDMEGMSFEKYARAIDPFGADEFDVILVDGRARTSCIVQAIPHLKTGGLLVVDNAERLLLPQPAEVFWGDRFQIELDSHAALPYSPDFTTTLILKKR